MSTTLLEPPALASPSARRAWPGALLRYLFCFALLPNLPFWLLGRREGIAISGWFSLDGLLFGVAAFFLRPSFLYPLFVADFLLDIADAICHTYGVGFVDVARSAGYATQILAHSSLRSIALLIGIFLALVAAAWVWLRPRINPPQRGFLALSLLVLSLLAAWASPRSVRSPFADFTHAFPREHMWDRLRGVGPDAMATAASAADQARPFLQSGHPNLAVVLVESWGQANAASLRAALLQPFLTTSVYRRYQVRTGLVHFNGPTGNGVMRELCDLNRGVPSEGVLAPPAQLHACLPYRLQAQGYHTIAMDGVDQFWPGGANFFHRLGIQQVVGHAHFQALGVPSFTAGPFPAFLEKDVAAQLPHLLASTGHQPAFVFYLTVSAHLPVNLPLPPGFEGDCSLSPTTRNSPQACGWYLIERRTLAAIAAAATDPATPPTVFAIVGDHNPPFVDTARDDFSFDQVPYVILAPHPSR